jgi:integrase
MSGRRTFGNVRKLPSGSYQASYWHEGERHIAPHTFASKATANAYLATVEADIRRGGWIDPRAGTVMLRDYANQWLDRRPELAARTAELYRYLLDNHVLPELGHITLAGLSPSKVRAWHAALAKDHAVTAAKAYRLASTILKTAVADGLIVASPCKVKGAGAEHSPERPHATVAEVGTLAAAMPERLRLLVLLATWCQLRRGELLGLRRRDVDVLHATISVEQARTILASGRSLLKAPKTAAGRRVLSIPLSVVDAITEHLLRFVAPEPDALLFTGEKGGPLSSGVLAQAWSQARDTIGRPDLHLHDLRHVGLTLAAATGATTAELMHRAGHSSPAAALRYQHATRERDKVIAEALAALVTPAPVVPISAATP